MLNKIAGVAVILSTLAFGGVSFNLGNSRNYDVDEYRYFDGNSQLRYLHRQCLKGRKFSCMRIAEKFYYGLGVRKNLDMAFRYYNKACDLGDKMGCTKAERIMRYGW
jgi:TPR repeat protein